MDSWIERLDRSSEWHIEFLNLGEAPAYGEDLTLALTRLAVAVEKLVRSHTPQPWAVDLMV